MVKGRDAGCLRVWLRLGLALLFIIPAVGAAATQFEDDDNDVRMTTSNGAFRNGAGGSTWRNLDILSGGIHEETDERVVFFLNVTSLKAEQEPPLPKSQPTYWFYFNYGERTYRIVGVTDIRAPADDFLGPPQRAARLEMAYDEDHFITAGEAELDLDFEQNQVRFTVDRVLIRDHNEAPLGKGQVLSEFWGYSRSLGWGGLALPANNLRVEAGPPAYSDEAPDFGAKGGSYETVAGRQLRKGLLLAAAEDPVRWTNGEATTFVYYVRLFNQGGTELEVALSHERVDPSWQIAFSDRLTVPAHGAINVTFHVGIPFGHFHGKLHEFTVGFHTDDGAHWAKQPLAVYWPTIPQPAGHHPQLWLHSKYQPREAPMESLGDRTHGWLSAADPNTEGFDEQVPIRADIIEGPEADGRSNASWVLKLEPSLRMGLDFLLDKSGQGEITINFPVQVQDPKLQLDIVHLNKRTIIPKQTLAISAVSELPGTQTGAVTFSFPELTAEREADLIRYAARADLEFRFDLSAILVGKGLENPEDYTPTILPGDSTMVLPLREYHDPLDTVFVTDAAVQVTVGPEGQEKKVNPGKQAVFTFDLFYRGTFRSGFDIELSGINSEWARVLGDAHFDMDPGTTREVAVVIQPPTTASSGDYADITIKAIGSVNAAVQAGIVVRADVIGGQGIEDESELALEKEQLLTTAESKDSVVWPWFVFTPLALVAVAAGVLWRFRPDLLLFWR